jgi:hypothetical protein
MKIVINKCYGGFSLSREAEDYLNIKSYGEGRDIKRNDPKLIECIEKLGDNANGSCAELEIIEIPDNIDWQIEEYDGMEWVAENHRTWS